MDICGPRFVCFLVCFLMSFLVIKFCTISIYLVGGVVLSLQKMIMSGTRCRRFPVVERWEHVIRPSQSDIVARNLSQDSNTRNQAGGSFPSGRNDVSSGTTTLGIVGSHCPLLASMLRKVSSYSSCRVVDAGIPAIWSPFHTIVPPFTSSPSP